jgi:uncharacterized protein YneF (UPF0154 family)
MKSCTDLALILIGQFLWAEQIKSYNGNTTRITLRDIRQLCQQIGVVRVVCVGDAG